jgi:FkbM family methyltransferase
VKLLPTLTTGRRVLRRLAQHPGAVDRPIAPLWRFALWQVRKRIRPRPITISAFGGAELRCYPDNAATNAVIYLGWPDWNEMHLLRDLLRPGDGFLDVGANVGVYSVLATTRIQPGGVVLAIEAEPNLAKRLIENLRLNGFDEDAVCQVAVGESVRTCRFTAGRDSVGGVLADPSATDGREVQMRPLDDLVPFPEKFAVGKIDIEGYELSAFLGARRLLESRWPRCWLIETNRASERYGTGRTELQQLLGQFGFDLFEVTHAGRALKRIPQGGPFPENALAVGDLEWLRSRLPGLTLR